MNSLEGIVAANRNAERIQAENRIQNGAEKPDDRAAISRAVRRTRQNLQPTRDASGRLAR